MRPLNRIRLPQRVFTVQGIEISLIRGQRWLKV